MPVMEGKAVLFKALGDVDASRSASTPLMSRRSSRRSSGWRRPSVASTWRTSRHSAASRSRTGSRSGSTSRSSTTTGTAHAVVALAALTNALTLTGRDAGSTRVVISGAGAAGGRSGPDLLEAGVKDLAVTDRKGVLHSSRGDLTPVKRALAAMTADQTGRSGALADVLAGRTSTSGSPAAPCPRSRWPAWRRSRSSSAWRIPTPRCTRRGAQVRADRGHRPLRLPQPDQQRARLPRHLPRRLRRACHRDHRGDKPPRRSRWPAWWATTWPTISSSPTPFDPRVGTAVSTAVAEAARRDGVARAS